MPSEYVVVHRRDHAVARKSIEGEAGIGYGLNRAARLPPLTFTADELAALAAGTRTFGVWCELHSGFRNFGLERIRDLTVLESYPDQEGRRVADWLRHVNAKLR